MLHVCKINFFHDKILVANSFCWHKECTDSTGHSVWILCACSTCTRFSAVPTHAGNSTEMKTARVHLCKSWSVLQIHPFHAFWAGCDFQCGATVEFLTKNVALPRNLFVSTRKLVFILCIFPPYLHCWKPKQTKANDNQWYRVVGESASQFSRTRSKVRLAEGVVW